MAVVPVVLFHSEFHWPRGGFVGVDVFFVISGFLIGRLIQTEVDAGRFSIAAFYERRLRRIFPALVVVIAACIVAGWMLALPVAYAGLGKSIVATLFFSSNFFFWSQTGYFNPGALTKPLLHTWSLAVEEQFYIVFPVLLILVHRFARGWLLAITWVLTLLSFGVSAWMAHEMPEAAFYLPQSRAWELLLGALIAFGASPRITDPRLREALAAAGLALIAGAMLFLGEWAPFPGFSALAPCIGAALILVTGERAAGEPPTLVARLLATPVPVFIGLISYSLYLWHWPIFVFYRWYPSASNGKPVTVLLCALAFGLATLSWRYVEQPWRYSRWLAGRRRIFGSAAIAATLILAAGMTVFATGGFIGRFPPEIVSIDAYSAPSPEIFASRSCWFESARPDLESRTFDTCLHIAPDKKNYLLIGDSHANHFWWQLTHTFPEINLLQATASGCRPFADTGRPKRCALLEYALRKVLPTGKVDVVIMSADWGAGDLRQLPAAIAYARQFAPVYFLGPIVHYDRPLPALLIDALYYGDAGAVDRHRVPGRKEFDRKFRAAAEAAGARYISTYDAVCPDDRCTVLVAPGIPMQMDQAHLTAPGAQRLMDGWKATGALP